MKLPLPSLLKPRLKTLGFICLATLGTGLGGYFLLPFAFPVPEGISAGPGNSVVLLDRDGARLDHWVRKDYYRHRATALDDLPEDLIRATLAAEDKRFYQHGGIDFRATARALKDSWDRKRFVSGASTISQQTIKLSSEKTGRTFVTKLRECLTARHLEMCFSKDEILTAYFNHLDYGNRSQGPLQAARHYFGKPLDRLSLAECALLAGLPQAPSRLNPRRNPEAALKRRDWILDRMAAVYRLSPERVALAKAEPLKLHRGKHGSAAPHLVQLMKHSRNKYGGIGKLRGVSPSIRTTLSAGLQRDVTAIMREQVKLLGKKHIQHAAVVVIDNATGEVLAHVGSPDFSRSNSGQIDAARTPRSPGSALKPFTYLLAYEKGGMTPATIVEDIPTRYPDARGAKDVVNYSRRHSGPVTIHTALASSLNVPAVRVLNTLGGAAPLVRQLRGFGISTLNEKPTHYGLGLTLGSGEVTLLELTNAYATLARMGVFRPVTYLARDRTRPGDARHVASYRSCWMIARTMTDNAPRTAAFGPNSSLRLPFRCAVKTGTSTDFRDNWCLGFTKDFTVGVWVGNLDNTPMRGISGVSGAGPIFHATMLRLHQDHRPAWYDRPGGMVDCHIHVNTGKRLPKNTGDSVLMVLPRNQLPTNSQPEDFDSRGRVLLDIRYAQWMAGEGDHQRFALVRAGDRPAASLAPLHILSPSRDARYLLDPDLPGQGRRLELKTDFPGAVTWSSPTLEITTSGRTSTATLTAGEHQITLKDEHGRSTSQTIIVEQL